MSDDRPQDMPRYGSQPPHQQQQASASYQQNPQYPPTPYEPAPYAPMGPQTREHSTGIVALVLGIAAFATGILLLSPFAWWLGKKAMNEIDAAPGTYGNRGMALAGYVMGIIGSVLLALFILGLIALIVGLYSVS
jgi:hypothetical protein